MLLLVALTATAALLVTQNTLELLVGIKALPMASAQKFSLGSYSLSKLGLTGSVLEVILILYLWCASVVGLYSLPIICRVRPVFGDTSFTQIIGNCVLLLVLSSALPVLSRIVGITNFDLLGDFGRIEWLGSFNIVLIYNLFFASSTAFSLVNKFTEPVRRELLKRLKGLFADDGVFSFLNRGSQFRERDTHGSSFSSTTSSSPLSRSSSVVYHTKNRDTESPFKVNGHPTSVSSSSTLKQSQGMNGLSPHPSVASDAVKKNLFSENNVLRKFE